MTARPTRHRPVRRRPVAALLLAALVWVAVVAPGGAGAAPPRPENRDFATEVLGDPWDFANPEDAPLTHGPPVSMFVSGARVHDGVAEWRSDGGYLDLHPMTIPGALPDSRDGRWSPVDADVYTHVSLRLHASERVPFRVGWFVCARDYSDDCFAYHDFTVEAGWHTYTLPMRERSAEWRGDLLGIRLANGDAATFRLDWLRIHTEDSSATPPAEAPQPRILRPGPAGSETDARVWRFDSAGDVVASGNVDGLRVAEGHVRGTNGGPVVNDPWVQLATGAGVDPQRHHLLTVTTTYDGPFSLADAPGGGTHGRLLFRRADTGSAWIDGRELVTYPSRPTVTYDLHDDRFGATVEPGNPSWTGSTVTALRWDPNEDRGARSWRVDEIRLAAPHATSGFFDVVWTDPAHVGGTTVDVGVSRDRGDTAGPALVSGVPQRDGENRVRLDLSRLAPGSWWVWVRATSPSGVTTATTATGVLEGTGRLAGPDRVATAQVLSELGWPTGADVAVVASARGFPDALAGVQLADAADAPLLLTEPDRLTDPLLAELRRLGPSEVVVLGGPAAVAPGVVDAIAQAVPDATLRRVAGDDRYATAARIAAEAVRRWQDADLDVADEVMVASGTSFPDALAAGPLVAATRTPLLLTDPERLPDPTRDALRSYGQASVVVVGGPTAVRPAVGDATGRPVRRIAGPDRYDTARRLADAAVAAGATPARPLVASGEDFPDALGAGAFATRTGQVLLLAARGAVPAPTEAWLARPEVTGTVVVGGPVAVHPDVVARLHATARG